MPIAFTTPDGPASARVELATTQSTQTAVMLPVPPLIPAQELLGLDGSAPVGAVLLAAPHPRGMYLWSQYIPLLVPAGAQVDCTLSWTDESGPQLFVFTQNLGSLGLFQPPPLPFFSDGSADIRVDLTFGGAVGPPLLLDYITSIAQTG